MGIRVISKEDVLSAIYNATEEAILNSLAVAKTVTGYHGATKYSLSDLYLKEMSIRKQ